VLLDKFCYSLGTVDGFVFVEVDGMVVSVFPDYTEAECVEGGYVAVGWDFAADIFYDGFVVGEEEDLAGWVTDCNLTEELGFTGTRG